MAPASQFGLIVENIGAGEVVVIAFLVLVVLGPDRIPEMARSAGRMINNVKKFSSNLSGDMADVINDPAMQPIKELGEFAARPRQKLAEYALEAEADERQKAADEGVRQSAAAAGTAVEREGDDDGDADPADTADSRDSGEAQDDPGTAGTPDGATAGDTEAP